MRFFITFFEDISETFEIKANVKEHEKNVYLNAESKPEEDCPYLYQFSIYLQKPENNIWHSIRIENISPWFRFKSPHSNGFAHHKNS